MTILAKKLKVKDSIGIISECNIYTTKEEAGEKSLPLKVDGVSCYVALKPITEAEVTKAKVLFNDNSIWAIAKSGEFPVVAGTKEISGYTEFIVPDHVKIIKASITGYFDNKTYTKYIGVTPNKTYYLQAGLFGVGVPHHPLYGEFFGVALFRFKTAGHQDTTPNDAFTWVTEEQHKAPPMNFNASMPYPSTLEWSKEINRHPAEVEQY